MCSSIVYIGDRSYIMGFLRFLFSGLASDVLRGFFPLFLFLKDASSAR